MNAPVCSNCGASTIPGARFCMSCGARLGGLSLVRSRFMSVLFCDLAESTALTERIGDEAMFDLIMRFQAICQAVTDANGGYVAKYTGDGMLAYFGYPEAMKNSAATAITAALEIIAQV
ncbi:MAG TPA: zinc-ribbon domain-containing protein, partial [Paracoccaceae bacterium]|nr:zinc-ribbon domain-containing protein [Paracoccaceae bacterium]